FTAHHRRHIRQVIDWHSLDHWTRRDLAAVLAHDRQGTVDYRCHHVDLVLKGHVERADQLEGRIGHANRDAGSAVGLHPEIGRANARSVLARAEQTVIGDLVGYRERHATGDVPGDLPGN